jgi:hypothetical protein
MKYWALAADPAICWTQEAVAALERDLWSTGRSQIELGDRVAIWNYKGNHVSV